ncbi:MAG: winged helix-turn-helix domain-containing protein [Candidatus Hodarchaeota archaeon]
MFVMNKIEKNKEEPPIEEVLSSKGRVKILRLLAEEGELNISEIINRTRLNHTITLKHLDQLAKAGIVQEKKFGRIRIYRYCIEQSRARALKNLFQLW